MWMREDNVFTLRTGYSGTHRRRVSKRSSELKHPTFPIKECKTMDVGVYLYQQSTKPLISWIRVRSERGNRKWCQILFIPGKHGNKRTRKRVPQQTTLPNNLCQARSHRKYCHRKFDKESAKELWAAIELESMNLYRSSQIVLWFFHSHIQQPSCVMKEII